jgi:Fe2+ or Zn2+ uptake regulation protein
MTDSIVCEGANRLLITYNIEPTPMRIQILNIIMSMADQEFTIANIISSLRNEIPSISISSVTSTTRLFKARKLISEINDSENILPMNHFKRGRPEIKFIYEHKDTIDSLC